MWKKEEGQSTMIINSEVAEDCGWGDLSTPINNSCMENAFYSYFEGRIKATSCTVYEVLDDKTSVSHTTFAMGIRGISHIPKVLFTNLLKAIDCYSGGKDLILRRLPNAEIDQEEDTVVISARIGFIPKGRTIKYMDDELMPIYTKNKHDGREKDKIFTSAGYKYDYNSMYYVKGESKFWWEVVAQKTVPELIKLIEKEKAL